MWMLYISMWGHIYIQTFSRGFARHCSVSFTCSTLCCYIKTLVQYVVQEKLPWPFVKPSVHVHEFPLSHSSPFSLLSELKIIALFERPGSALEASLYRLRQISRFAVCELHRGKTGCKLKWAKHRSLCRCNRKHHAMLVLLVTSQEPCTYQARRSITCWHDRQEHFTCSCTGSWFVHHQVCHWLGRVKFKIKWLQIFRRIQGTAGL